jgi:hypothetical protein
VWQDGEEQQKTKAKEETGFLSRVFCPFSLSPRWFSLFFFSPSSLLFLSLFSSLLSFYRGREREEVYRGKEGKREREERGKKRR